jgi:spermidine synthase
MIKQPIRVIQTPFEYLASVAKGLPFIYEDDQIKSLHFNALAIQSSMLKNAPFDLELSYTQTMMGFLLLQPVPRSILIVGLGGGSLSKYCYRHFPNCQITTVESHEQVISVRNEFVIPPDEERFNVVHADGANYIAGLRNSADIIMLDAYDAHGLPRRLRSQRFYNHCFLALRDNGVLVSNLLKSDLRMGTYIGRIHRAFDKKVIKVKAENNDNDIVYALKRDRMPQEVELLDRSLALQVRHGINFPAIVSQMRASMRSDQMFV